MPKAKTTALTVNDLLMAHPAQALEIMGGLLVVGAALKFRDILNAIGVKPADETPAEQLEVELLDEASAGQGFWHGALRVVHSTLAESTANKMVGLKAAAPQITWHRGLWNVRHRGVTMSGEPIMSGHGKPIDWTDVTTPMLDEKSGELV